MRRLAATAVVPLLVASACAAAAGEPSADDDRVVIATSVAPITSIVSSIVGDRASVHGIVPEGTNSHTFEPEPSIAELLSEADVVFLNGLGLEAPTKELALANLADGAELVELGEQTLPEDEYIFDVAFPESGGLPNPHLWTDPLLVRQYAAVVRDTMSERDPANADRYAANYEAFSDQIAELDAAMRTSFATVPRRKLLTYHDAYAYFAEDYGWDVIGAIQVSDFEDPTAGQVADLIEQIRTEEVPAIFGSEVFPSPVLEQIGRETGADHVEVLRDDDLPGEPGDPEHSWLGLVLFDYITMTEALGGDASALRSLEPEPTAPDEADYPQ